MAIFAAPIAKTSRKTKSSYRGGTLGGDDDAGGHVLCRLDNHKHKVAIHWN